MISRALMIAIRGKMNNIYIFAVRIEFLRCKEEFSEKLIETIEEIINEIKLKTGKYPNTRISDRSIENIGDFRIVTSDFNSYVMIKFMIIGEGDAGIEINEE